ncbi:MAG: NnrS family protein, partial [Pseudomonadaceae bacterium]|nr:NnrS family protein [Pseudomonadaceae bacterium]
ASGLALQPSPWLALPFAAFGLGHLVRLVRWHDSGIWRVDLLWSLHLAFAWMLLSALGLGLWHLGVLANSSQSLHALAIGGMSGLILAMIARVSLGHTGRDLKTPKAMHWAFALLNAGAAARVLLVGVWPQAALWLAAACWISAFGLYLYYYAPLLMQARPDGHPG